MQSKPNILVFMVDQMPGEVVLPGHPCRMPRVEALAREGVTFSQTFTPSPHCCPSRATFMTGLYPSRHGINNNVDTDTAHQLSLNPGVRLFSEDLASAGYTLAHAGKWHVSHTETPADRAWQELCTYSKNGPLRGWDRVPAMCAVTRRAEDCKETVPSPTLRRVGWGDFPLLPRVSEESNSHLNDHWYRWGVKPAVQWLRERTADDGPWCLFVSTDMAAHSPAPREMLELYEPAQLPLPDTYSDTLRDKPAVYRRMRRQLWDQASPDDARMILANFWANCSREDAYFGMLLDALDETGLAQNTLVLFVGDHGDYAFSHGLLHMGIPAFREAYHVPAVIRWPAGIKATGRTVDRFVTLADFAPTFLELAGVEPHDRKTGRSLVPFLEDCIPDDWADEVHTQTCGNEVYYTQRSVTTDTHKYVYNAFDFDEMYDLIADPGEMTNLVHPDNVPGCDDLPADDTHGTNPWPHLPPDLNAIRRDLLRRMWTFAYREKDKIFSAYPPCALAPFGPGIADVEV